MKLQYNNVGSPYTQNIQIKAQANAQQIASQEINSLVFQLGKNVQMPDYYKNYCIFNMPVVNRLVQYREAAVPAIVNVLKTAHEEKVIAEGIYTLDRMIDAGVKNIDKTYPVLSRFNNTTSPVVQSLLAGVYRKTQVPDAFGPLWRMMIRNTMLPACPYFDPNEEVGGAILEYIRNKGAQNLYAK